VGLIIGGQTVSTLDVGISQNKSRHKIIEELTQKAKTIPAMPATAAEILRLLEDKNVDVKKVTNVIATDPALATKILQMSNSAYYGLRGKVNTLHHAVTLLGLGEIKSTLIGLHVFDLIKSTIKSKRSEIQALWRHSIIAGLAARVLTSHFKFSSIGLGEALIAGLLHDIGKLIIIMHHEEKHNLILKMCKETGCTEIEAEEQILGANHCEIGWWLADKWNLPIIHQQCIAYHHFPSRADSYEEAVAIMHIANILTLYREKQDQDSQAPTLVVPLPETILGGRELIIDTDLATELISKIDQEISSTGMFQAFDFDPDMELDGMSTSSGDTVESSLVKAEDEIRKAAVPRKKKTRSPWFSVIWPGLTQFLEGKEKQAMPFMIIYAVLLVILIGLLASGVESVPIITATVAGMVIDMIASIANTKKPA
jgi:HD-like signal output (HDOD) protein